MVQDAPVPSPPVQPDLHHHLSTDNTVLDPGNLLQFRLLQLHQPNVPQDAPARSAVQGSMVGVHEYQPALEHQDEVSVRLHRLDQGEPALRYHAGIHVPLHRIRHRRRVVRHHRLRLNRRHQPLLEGTSPVHNLLTPLTSALPDM